MPMLQMPILPLTAYRFLYDHGLTGRREAAEK